MQLPLGPSEKQRRGSEIALRYGTDGNFGVIGGGGGGSNLCQNGIT